MVPEMNDEGGVRKWNGASGRASVEVGDCVPCGETCMVAEVKSFKSELGKE